MSFLKTTSVLSLIVLTAACKQGSELPMGPPEIKPKPPFFGTIFLDPDILTENDPTTFLDLSYAGQATRSMFDRRAGDWITVVAFLFNSNFDDELTIEIQVNPEFETREAAEVEALKYAEVIGRLPTALRRDVEMIWIHKGTEVFGGGYNSLLIHTGQAALHESDGILEEVFIHEASHTSLDADHANSAGWQAAQSADGNYISTYARDYPIREDVAETFTAYFAIRYRSERISDSLESTILETIPARIAYLDEQGFDMYPIE